MEHLNIKRLIVTKDGSHTFFVEALNEHYHSTHGAVQESMHVYIGQGLKPLLHENRPLHIFEMGFGTGLNALLTILESTDTNIHYTTVEAFPLTQDEIALLNYPSTINNPLATELFEKLHAAKWNEPVQLTLTFTLQKLHANISDLNFAANTFDLVYYDAFAPSVQPELWTPEIFKQLHDWLKPGGVLVTYSAKGALKRTLAALGFKVENPPGPPGKYEMTKGIKM